MNTNIQTELLLSCENGNLKEYRHLLANLSPEEQLAFVKSNDYQCFHLAMAHGHLGIVNEIAKLIFNKNNDDMDVLIDAFKARNYEGFKRALNNHYWNIIEYFMNDDYFQFYCFDILLEKEDYITLIWHHPSLKHFSSALFNLACQNLTSVKRFLNVIPFENIAHLFKKRKRDPSNPSSQWSPFENAAQANAVEVIEYLWNRIPNKLKEDTITFYFPECLIIAAKKGYTGVTDTILHFLDQEQQVKALSYEDYNSFVYAADRGHIDIMKLIWKTLPHRQQIEALMASHYAAYRLAFKNNDTSTLHFIESIASNELMDKMKKTIK